jgi:arylamine N-acetyltransferase
MDWTSLAPEKAHENAAADLLDRYGISTQVRNDDFLRAVAEIFARFPYENVTKLISKHTRPPGPQRFRLPKQVASEHLEHGAGGTCFSLSSLFGRMLALCGVESYAVLANMKSIRTLHTGLVVPYRGHRFLLDPGYLVHKPLRLVPGQETSAQTQVGTVRLSGSPDGKHYDLFTGQTWRYRLEDSPLSREVFVELWAQSFDWVMMNQVHLSRSLDGGYLYAHGHKIRQVSEGRKQNLNVRHRQPEALEEYFGLAAGMTAKALAILAEARSSTPVPTGQRG